ncbi:hypothetical protein [Streptomyces fructofermentans]|uniref:Integral membrane protein n=1 Tax=Streptomyces fructofermentans TaxID=152141 RepID=A0A918K0P2_9ACTN|nr:hypothetical protein [Streptomyces fructofermentans]GGX38400.1 hypothetical protein GCM10010515_00750 [Streptomyces fructofermentans]
MKRTERLITDVLRQIASRDVVVLEDPRGSTRRLAALTYTALQYGFQYKETTRTGRLLQVRLVRDLSAEARERSAATLARLAEGRTPGLRPGTLKPLPDEAPAVSLLAARIEFDAMSDDPHRGPKAVFVTAAVVLTALLLIAAGWQSALLTGATMGVLFAVYLRLEILRKRRLARRLRRARRR